MDRSGINFALVKECISFLAIPKSHIANICFEMGIFPDRMKIAKVIPIFKSGLKDSFNTVKFLIVAASPIEAATQTLKKLQFFNKNFPTLKTSK